MPARAKKVRGKRGIADGAFTGPRLIIVNSEICELTA